MPPDARALIYVNVSQRGNFAQRIGTEHFLTKFLGESLSLWERAARWERPKAATNQSAGEGRRICANLATLTRPFGGLSQRERRPFTEETREG